MRAQFEHFLNGTTNAPLRTADKQRVRERLDYHRSTPHISADAHEHLRRRALADEIKPRIKVYLDQNFWIDLTHARHGGKGQLHTELLEVLRAKVAQGKVICPAGEVVFTELMKNRSLEARLQVAELVQELSCGVAIQNAWDRSIHEFEALVTPNTTISPSELIWTKLSFVFGHPRPTPQVPMPAETRLLMQKAFFDTMWDQSFIRMVRMVGDMPGADLYEDSAARITRGSIEFEHELRSFQDAFEAEAYGAAWRLNPDEILNIFKAIGDAQGVPYPVMTPDQQEELIAMGRRVAGGALARRTQPAVEKLRTLMVMTLLHATFRWDMKNSGKDPKGGRMTVKANDLFDFDHAAAAIGYCDYFFTERQLYRRLTRPEVRIEEIYPCKPAFGVEAALAMAKAL